MICIESRELVKGKQVKVDSGKKIGSKRMDEVIEER